MNILKFFCCYFLVTIFSANISFGQDSVYQKNGGILAGKIILFEDNAFTLITSDNNEIKFDKNSVKKIVFDRDHAYEQTGILTQEEEIDPQCFKKGIGNAVLINETGEDLYFYYSFEGGDQVRNDLSANNSKITFYGLKAGNYKFTANTKGSARTITGGFYVPLCKSSKVIYIRKD